MEASTTEMNVAMRPIPIELTSGRTNVAVLSIWW